MERASSHADVFGIKLTKVFLAAGAPMKEMLEKYTMKRDLKLLTAASEATNAIATTA